MVDHGGVPTGVVIVPAARCFANALILSWNARSTRRPARRAAACQLSSKMAPIGRSWPCRPQPELYDHRLAASRAGGPESANPVAIGSGVLEVLESKLAPRSSPDRCHHVNWCKPSSPGALFQSGDGSLRLPEVGREHGARSGAAGRGPAKNGNCAGMAGTTNDRAPAGYRHAYFALAHR